MEDVNMSFRTLVLCVYLFKGADVNYGGDVFLPLEDRSFAAFECLSKSDITIQYVTNTTTNATSVHTIAECETDLQGCYLVEQKLGKYYAVYYTDRGAILYINKISEKTRGTYRCCETYNSKACYSNHTWPISGNITTDKTEIGNSRQTNFSSVAESLKTNKHALVALAVANIISVCTSIVLCVVLARRLLKNKKASLLPCLDHGPSKGNAEVNNEEPASDEEKMIPVSKNCNTKINAESILDDASLKPEV